MTTGRTIALTIWTFVGKVMSLLFNTLPRFVVVFLEMRKRLLISWLQSPSALISEPPPPNWNSPGKNTGVSSHSLLQEIFPTQVWNPGLLHCMQILYCLSHQGSSQGLLDIDRDSRLLGRRQWHPTPVLLPGKSYGWRSLVGCSTWGR